MKIGIVLKEGNQKTKDLVSVVEKYLQDKNVEVVGEDKLEGADFILTFGGDGTLIHSACEYVHFGATFVGINTGNLGFLTAVDAVDWRKAVDVILADKIFVSDRMMLDVKVDGKSFRGVNEAVIKGLYRVVSLKVGVNGEEFLKIMGDGVIVATQTGSTAYSLSAGGPIVDPELDSFLITPTNPIGLPIPSAVMNASNLVEIEVVKGEDVSLIIDGQEHTKVTTAQVIKISKAAERLKLGYLSRNHFIKALNMKFGLATRVNQS